MSLLNPKPAAKPLKTELSKNGNLQYAKKSVQELFELVVSTIYGRDTFYEKGCERLDRFRATLREVIQDHGVAGIKYALALAQFTRAKMYMRTMPLVLLVETAAAAREANLPLPGFRLAVANTISRADELLDIYAYAKTVMGEKVPVALKRGVADAFNKFDAYQLAKHDSRSGLNFRTLLRTVHPTPKDKTQSEIYEKIMQEALEPAQTWEALLSANGSLPLSERRSSAEIWTEMLTRKGPGSIGYMALLRNVRNIVKAEVSASMIELACTRLSDVDEVARSRQLPWAFINAYRVAVDEGLPMNVRTAISKAADHSIGNLPQLGKRLWIIIDCSGSMTMYSYSGYTRPNDVRVENGQYLIPAGENSPAKIAAIFGAALAKASANSEKLVVTLFADRAFHIELNPTDSIMTLSNQLIEQMRGGGTNLQSALDMKATLGFEPDTIAILSDMEVNKLTIRRDRLVADIDRNFAPGTLKLAVNLNASSATPLAPRNGWIQLAGWSENIFRYVDFTRHGSSIADSLFKSAQLADVADVGNVL